MALINKIERECISVLQQISSIIFQAIRVHKERQRCILVIEECTKRWNDPIVSALLQDLSRLSYMIK